VTGTTIWTRSSRPSSTKLQTSRRDPSIAFDVEDFTARKDAFNEEEPRTESYSIRGGNVEGSVTEARPSNPSARATLTRFVAHTLDEAQRNGAKQTWIDLVDHAGGDGGGLQNHLGKVMSSDDIAGAIADGVALHAQEHPEDADRDVDGIVANHKPLRKAPADEKELLYRRSVAAEPLTRSTRVPALDVPTSH
jgi:hypothetical protein